MDTQQILTDLRAELNRLNQAIAALELLGSPDGITPRRGRPAGTATVPAQPRGPRRMSPAARRRISAMMKARWAERKAASLGPKSQAAPKLARGGKRRISAAGRRRIAEAAKKMWARRRKAAKAAKA